MTCTQMFKTTLLIVIVLSLTIVNNVNAGTKSKRYINGYGDLKWGSSKEDVIKKYGDFTDTFDPKGCHPYDIMPIYLITTKENNSAVGQRWFFFLDGALYRVVVFYTPQETVNSVEDVFTTIISDYGDYDVYIENPKQSVSFLNCASNNTFNEAAWFDLKHTRIVLYATTRRNPLLDITYHAAVVDYRSKKLRKEKPLPVLFPSLFRKPKRVEQ